MKKKEYMSPDFKVVVLKSKNRLLVGSPKHKTVAIRNGEAPVPIIGGEGDDEDEELD